MRPLLSAMYEKLGENARRTCIFQQRLSKSGLETREQTTLARHRYSPVDRLPHVLRPWLVSGQITQAEQPPLPPISHPLFTLTLPSHLSTLHKGHGGDVGTNESTGQTPRHVCVKHARVGNSPMMVL